MYVSKVTLSGFRNLNEVEIDLCSGVNVILGDNGQGKTNFLESLFYLSQARSHRTRDDRDLIHHEHLEAHIQAEIESHQGSHHQKKVQIDFSQKSLSGRSRCQIRVNGMMMPNRSYLLGILPSVGFFFKDLNLLRGTPGDRRQWLDAAIAQDDIRHVDGLRDTEKIRKQKSELLRKAPYPITDSWVTQLTLWNEQYAKYAALVLERRLDYLNRLLPEALTRFQAFTESQSESLTVQYQSTLLPEAHDLLSEAYSHVELEAMLLERLQQRMSEEVARRACLVGPHRDQLLFDINGKDAIQFGSQGQQRSIILALKMAEVSLLSERFGESPVLLLDDVMAELDPFRQGQLMQLRPKDAQVIMTTTHLSQTSHIAEVTDIPQEQTMVFAVHHGLIEKQEVEQIEPNTALETIDVGGGE